MEENIIPSENEEQQFEMNPEEATSIEGKSGAPGLFNRKRVLIFLTAVLAGTVILGVLLNSIKSSKQPGTSGVDENAQSRSNAAFLSQLQTNALRNASYNPEQEIYPVTEEEIEPLMPEPLLPPVMFERQYQEPPSDNRPVQQQQSPPYQPPASSGQQDASHFTSSLVPQMQGSLFNNQNSSFGSSQQYNASSAAAPYDDYLDYLSSRTNSMGGNQTQAQVQENAYQDFYGSSNNAGSVFTGEYLGENSLWTGTVIPGILETAVNTDLPGQVLARVTQNIYDSQTGRSLLIPQGSVLIARYNSSVSYAQSRVQIIWDTLIRPDGFQIELEGANGVDRTGMSGQDAAYHGNCYHVFNRQRQINRNR